jgi:hypothetical protein
MQACYLEQIETELPWPASYMYLLPNVKPLISPNGQRRTVFFAGKDEVGTTLASCITAVWLARQGHRTLLLPVWATCWAYRWETM